MSESVNGMLATLRNAGCVVGLVDGDIDIDGPESVLTDTVVDWLRDHRSDLLRELSSKTTSVVCPWCKSANLLDDSAGIRCDDCKRLAWNDVGGSLVRCDIENDIEFNDPADIDRCGLCGQLCDTMTATGSWECSPCNPHRRTTTDKWLRYRQRIEIRKEQSRR